MVAVTMGACRNPSHSPRLRASERQMATMNEQQVREWCYLSATYRPGLRDARQTQPILPSGCCVRGCCAEIERLRTIEDAARAFWDVVRRTDAHHEWLGTVGALGRVLEQARKE